jgi:hypothetical protein
MDEDTDSDDDESDMEGSSPFRVRQRSNWTVRTRLDRQRRSDLQRQREQDAAVNRRIWRPSMRHGGCINTASWLDCPWRLSLAGADGSIVPSSGTANVVASLRVRHSWSRQEMIAWSSSGMYEMPWEARTYLVAGIRFAHSHQPKDHPASQKFAHLG